MDLLGVYHTEIVTDAVALLVAITNFDYCHLEGINPDQRAEY